jgi:hypothetical protein
MLAALVLQVQQKAEGAQGLSECACVDLRVFVRCCACLLSLLNSTDACIDVHPPEARPDLTIKTLLLKTLQGHTGDLPSGGCHPVAPGDCAIHRTRQRQGGRHSC